jgi:hypothetical protein
MKRTTIALRWEPEVAFHLELQQVVPVARSLTQFDSFIPFEDESWGGEARP